MGPGPSLDVSRGWNDGPHPSTGRNFCDSLGRVAARDCAGDLDRFVMCLSPPAEPWVFFFFCFLSSPRGLGPLCTLASGIGRFVLFSLSLSSCGRRWAGELLAGAAY